MTNRETVAGLLSSLCDDPKQPLQVCVGAWKSMSAADHLVQTNRPMSTSPLAEEILLDFSALTHKRLQTLDNPKCFNEVKLYLGGLLSEVSLYDLGFQLEQEKITHIGKSEGQIAEAALDVCIERGIYKPIQMPQVQSVRVPG